MIEQPDDRGTSLTFCAFDEETGADMPIPFVGTRETKDFVSILITYRRKYFERGVAEGYTDRQNQLELRFDSSDPVTLSENQDNELGGFVYELLMNAYQHGCLDAEGKVIPGVRYVRLRKHIESEGTTGSSRRLTGTSKVFGAGYI